MDQVSEILYCSFLSGASNLLRVRGLLLGYEESSVSVLSYRLRGGTSPKFLNRKTLLQKSLQPFKNLIGQQIYTPRLTI